MPLSGEGQHIKRLRERAGFTRDELARKLGLSYWAVAKYETGERSPPSDMLVKIADLFAVSTDYLLSRPADALPLGATLRIPVIRAIDAGDPTYVAEQIEGWEDVSEDLARTGKLFFLRVRDDSMDGTRTRIHEGALVLVREQSEVEDGKVVVVLVGSDAATLRRVYHQGDQLLLTADNPRYPPRLVAAGEARIVGVVIEIRSKPD